MHMCYLYEYTAAPIAVQRLVILQFVISEKHWGLIAEATGRIFISTIDLYTLLLITSKMYNTKG